MDEQGHQREAYSNLLRLKRHSLIKTIEGISYYECDRDDRYIVAASAEHMLAKVTNFYEFDDMDRTEDGDLNDYSYVLHAGILMCKFEMETLEARVRAEPNMPEVLRIELVVNTFRQYVAEIAAWEDKEYLKQYAADYIEAETGLPNLYIREVINTIYDGENSA